jgi:hypothetical protein
MSSQPHHYIRHSQVVTSFVHRLHSVGDLVSIVEHPNDALPVTRGEEDCKLNKSGAVLLYSEYC